MTGEILFLAHRVPFPPDRGDKIRSHYVLKRLTDIAPVHVATLADNGDDMMQQGALAEVAQSYKIARRIKPLVLAGAEAVVSGLPVSFAAFHSFALDTYVSRLVATRPIAAIYVFSSQMAQYVPKGFEGRVIADFVDVDSAKFEAYAARHVGVRGWIDAREARLLRQQEACLADRSEVCLLVSDEEGALFVERLPERLRASTNVKIMRNGIDSDSFDPDIVDCEERMMSFPAPRLIFTGQMDYAPNILAVERVATRILPEVRKHIPNASFHVVGRNPPKALQERHRGEGCHVWGAVPDTRPWLTAADLALVPLDIGRGVQNKVLEAMSMALPVVLTRDAASGIGAIDGKHLCVGRSDEELAASVIGLLTDKDAASRLGAAARKFVVDNASWEAALADLPEYVGLAGSDVRHAA